MAINTQVNADHHAPPITQILAKFISSHPSKGWDDTVDHEAHRTFMNWVGCAIGAAQHESVQATLAAMREFQTAEQASILGRSEKVDMASAALINGISSHTFDFDDTHLKTIIHPAGPIASAILALGEKLGSSGRDLIDALVIGIDVSCRIGNAMYPNHYDRGWHITGSTGTVGAAAACARLLKLSEHQTTMALGIAASQPIGFREQFGTMTKPFHPGGAAKAGLTSALMAKHGFTASLKALEAPRGMIQTVSTKYDWTEITHELGERFEISLNTYKPFACGIVIHPSIDACVQLRNQGVTADNLERLELKAHSLVLELTGKKTPKDGLEGKFSVYHGCACGIVYGQATEDQYHDEVVQSPEMVALRAKVVATVDNSIDEASADVTAILKDGKKIHVFVEHAIGSVKNPMTDQHLNEKFSNLSIPVIGESQTSSVIAKCWDLKNITHIQDLLQFAKPV
jgi:2-methylcitrate dehydratase PrpD